MILHRLSHIEHDTKLMMQSANLYVLMTKYNACSFYYNVLVRVIIIKLPKLSEMYHAYCATSVLTNTIWLASMFQGP